MEISWESLEKGWQASFNKGWQAYMAGNPPIGAAILDKNNKIISFGRHRILDRVGEIGSLHGTILSHATINTILQAGDIPRETAGDYTLYSTIEPCSLCFGAAVMGRIKHIKYAATDPADGACDANRRSGFGEKKGILIEGPFPGIQELLVALLTCYKYEQGHKSEKSVMLTEWGLDCPSGFQAGLQLFGTDALRDFAKRGVTVNEVINYIGKIL